VPWAKPPNVQPVDSFFERTWSPADAGASEGALQKSQSRTTMGGFRARSAIASAAPRPLASSHSWRGLFHLTLRSRTVPLHTAWPARTWCRRRGLRGCRRGCRRSTRVRRDSARSVTPSAGKAVAAIPEVSDRRGRSSVSGTGQRQSSWIGICIPQLALMVRDQLRVKILC
jgi:hypothetical protein